MVTVKLEVCDVPPDVLEDADTTTVLVPSGEAPVPCPSRITKTPHPIVEIPAPSAAKPRMVPRNARQLFRRLPRGRKQSASKPPTPPKGTARLGHAELGGVASDNFWPAVAMVRVVVAGTPLEVIVLGEKAHVVLAGNPEQVSWTVPLNPPTGVIVTATVPDPPATIVSDAGLIVIAKSEAAFTTNCTLWAALA
jgi:hypothetical protein